MLETYAKVFSDSDKWYDACLPVCYSTDVVDVISIFSNIKKKVSSLGNDVYTTGMWHETNSQKDGFIKFDVGFSDGSEDSIYSGAQISIANPVFQSTRSNYKVNSDYDSVDLTNIPEDYTIRTKYKVSCEIQKYKSNVLQTPWGTYVDDE